MKKFVINYVRGQASIVEVECEILPFDPLSSLKDAEYRAVISKPDFLFEKQSNGSLIAPIYYWFAFYDSADDAMSHLRKMTMQSLLRDHMKRKAINPSIENVITNIEDIMSAIPVINL